MNFNSHEVAWQDLEVFIDGKRVSKIKSLKYKWAQEMEYLRGAGNKPIGIQPGDISPAGEFMVLKGALEDLNKAARAKGYQSIVGCPFTIVADYKQTLTTPRQTDTLGYCMVSEYEKALAGNGKSMEITLPFLFLELVSVGG